METPSKKCCRFEASWMVGIEGGSPKPYKAMVWVVTVTGGEKDT